MIKIRFFFLFIFCINTVFTEALRQKMYGKLLSVFSSRVLKYVSLAGTGFFLGKLCFEDKKCPHKKGIKGIKERFKTNTDRYIRMISKYKKEVLDETNDDNKNDAALSDLKDEALFIPKSPLGAGDSSAQKAYLLKMHTGKKNKINDSDETIFNILHYAHSYEGSSDFIGQIQTEFFSSLSVFYYLHFYERWCLACARFLSKKFSQQLGDTDFPISENIRVDGIYLFMMQLLDCIEKEYPFFDLFSVTKNDRGIIQKDQKGGWNYCHAYEYMEPLTKYFNEYNEHEKNNIKNDIKILYDTFLYQGKKEDFYKQIDDFICFMDFASCIYAKDQNDFESLFNKKEQYEITPLIKSILNIYIAYAKKYEHSAKLFSTSFESSVKVEEGNDALQKLGIKPEEIIEARLITGKKQYNNYLIGFMYKEKI